MPPTLPVQKEAALPATSAPPVLPPPRALTAGGLAGVAEAKRQMLQTAEAPAQSFNARSAAPPASLSLARARSSAAAKFAVEYTLLLKDADGAYAPVPSGTVFHVGDSVRLQVEPRKPGYIYLFRRDLTAGWSLVASQKAEKAQRCVLPPTGGLQSNMPAGLELVLVLAPLEQPALATDQMGDVSALAAKAEASLTIVIEYR